MRAKLYGVRRVDMKAEDGRPITGYSCYIGAPTDGVEGEEVVKVFCSDAVCMRTGWRPTVGKAVRVEYNAKGRIMSIEDEK